MSKLQKVTSQTNNQDQHSSLPTRSSVQFLGKLKAQSKRKGALKENESNFKIIQAITKLDIEEIEEIHHHFQRYDLKKIDIVRYDEIDDILRDSGLEITQQHKQKIMYEMKKKDLRTADFKKVCEFYVMIRKVIDQEVDEANHQDFVNAFTALGGNADRSGTINKDYIINIIKNEFELTFNIERFLDKKGIEGQEINYQEFCGLFDHGDNMTQDILSLFSQKSASLNNYSDNQRNFKINYNNYSRWCFYDETQQEIKPKKSKKQSKKLILPLKSNKQKLKSNDSTQFQDKNMNENSTIIDNNNTQEHTQQELRSSVIKDTIKQDEDNESQQQKQEEQEQQPQKNQEEQEKKEESGQNGKQEEQNSGQSEQAPGQNKKEEENQQE